MNDGALAGLIVAGVNKAGTTSLYAHLAAHPDICPSSVKETCHFLPIRYGQQPAPLDEYGRFFAGCRPGQLAVEATPGYFYGGAPLAAAVHGALPEVKVVIVLREPVARLVSFFRFQQSMLALPAELTLEEYVERCDALDEAKLQADPALNPWFGVLGGHYDRWLPAWQVEFGADLRVCFADDLHRDSGQVVADLVSWVGLDPDRVDAVEPTRENATVGFRNRGLQRVALATNRRLERVFRANPALKQRLRGAYQRINAGSVAAGPDEALRAQLVERYRPAMQATARQLAATPTSALPPWLQDA